MDPDGAAAKLDKDRKPSAHANVLNEACANDEAIALALQRSLAAELERQEEADNDDDNERGDDQQQPVENQEELDRRLALELSRHDPQPQRDLDFGDISPLITARALQLVQRVQELFSLADWGPLLIQSGITPVAVDDMFFLAEKFLTTQAMFAKQGKPSTVDLGYHYTRQQNLDKIRTDGLLTKRERDSNQIRTTWNGSSYGDGIYSGNEPSKFTKYGDTGLLLARLKGVEMDSVQSNRCFEKGNDCISSTRNFVVLQHSHQCLALIQFPTRLVDTKLDVILKLERRIRSIVDELLGSAPSVPIEAIQVPDSVPPVVSTPDRVASPRSATPRSSLVVSPTSVARTPDIVSVDGRVPKSLLIRTDHTPFTLTYHAPESLTSNYDAPVYTIVRQPGRIRPEETCSVCLDPLLCIGTNTVTKIAEVNQCHHQFHQQCLDQHLSCTAVNCPSCRVLVREPRGTMPSGVMAVSYERNVFCLGYEGHGTIFIRYLLEGAVQKDYHPNPGRLHGSARRTAIIPDTLQGRQLLARLEYAFCRGLTFTVGTSLTTGREDSITWASIHHKTRGKGLHGYPDPEYLDNCNAELDALGVPRVVNS